MRNINIKLSVSERSEDLIKIAAMQFFFAEMPNRSSTFGYTQFKNWKLPDPMAYQEVFVPRIEYSHLNYFALLAEIENFISVMLDVAHSAINHCEVKTNA